MYYMTGGLRRGRQAEGGPRAGGGGAAKQKTHKYD